MVLQEIKFRRIFGLLELALQEIKFRRILGVLTLQIINVCVCVPPCVCVKMVANVRELGGTILGLGSRC